MPRFRIYHVDSTDQRLKGKYLFDVPNTSWNASDYEYNYIQSSSNLTTASQVVDTLNARSYISGMTVNIMYWGIDPITEGQRKMLASGFNGRFNSAYLQVGDRFYVGRWDHSHSYFQYVGSGQGLEYFIGYTSDGTVVYNRFGVQTTDSGYYFRGDTFPWRCNWNSDSDYALWRFATGIDDNSGVLQNFEFSPISSPVSIELAEAFWENAPIIDTDNPYEGGGGTEEGGGDEDRQNWDDASDAIVPDGLPTKGAMNSGMLKVFSPTETQVLDLTDLLFSYNFFDWLQKNLQNLEELFVSFGVVPFTVTKGATKSVTFLGFDISGFTHPVYLTEASEQYYEFDMGSIALNGTDARIHASDSVFDYSPFSRLGIYLPFIGFQELDIDECRGNTINLKYRVDIISGSTVALIFLNSDEEHCIYQFSGNCLSQIPLGSVDMSGIIAGSINIAVAAASAGASGAIASAGDALTAENLNAGDITPTAAALQNSQHAAQVAHGAGTLASATANGIMGMKPNFKHSGAIGSTGGLMAVKQPYLFLTTPREAVPASYQKYCGLPCNITDKLGNFRGYTVVEDIRLNGLVATSAEVEEIYNLLKSGVII